MDDKPIIGEVASSFLSTLTKRVPDLMHQRRINRQIEQIAESVAKSYLSLLKKEASSVSKERIDIVTNAVSETIKNTPITAELLVKCNLDPEELTQFFLQLKGVDGGNPGLSGIGQNSVFSEGEIKLYQRLISHASQLIVDVSRTFPKFDLHYNAEVLDRLAGLAEEVIGAMNRVLQQQNDAFEGEYRTFCIRKFDVLELFGVDLSDSTRKYKLSVAYVTLLVAPIDATLKDNEDLRDAVSADDALAGIDRLFVRGPAGSGKTTLLQWFTVMMAGRELQGKLAHLNEFVPFLIKLRDFNDTALPTPNQFLAQVSRALADRAPTNWAHTKLLSGQAAVLIDGLDEMQESRRSEVRVWLRDLLENYPQCRFIVSSRPHAAEEGWLDAESFVDSELQEMAREDIYRFIDHWHSAVAEKVRDEEDKEKLAALAQSLKSKLASNISLRRLATSPLLCALLCALHRERVENLPADRVELYRYCIEMFFRRDIERNIASVSDYIPLTDRQKHILLQDLAWWMITNRKTTATLAEVDNRFDSGLERLREKPADSDGAMVRRLMVERVGILRQLAAQKVDFPHRTFQEYLAAHAAIAEDNIEMLVHEANDDQFREVIILAAGLLPAHKAEQLLRKLLEVNRTPAQRRSICMIAMAALQAMVDLPSNSTVESEVVTRLKEVVPPRTIMAATELAAAGDLVVPHLKYNQRKSAPSIAASIRTLAIVGTAAAHEQLREYANDERPAVKKQILTSLQYASDPSHYAATAMAKVTHITETFARRAANPEVFFSCPSLQSLELSAHGLNELPQVSSADSLVKLQLRWARFENLDTLSNCTALMELDLDASSVKDIKGLAGCVSLTALNLSGNPVTDLSPLSNCKNLRRLDVSRTAVTDLSPISPEAELECLAAAYTDLCDISPGKNWESLRLLDLEGTAVTDLSFLGRCDLLKHIKINGTKIFDISPLEPCSNLEIFEGSETPISDISALAKCQSLNNVALYGTKILDISPLTACGMLETLDVSSSTLSQISNKTKFLALRSLFISNTSIKNFDFLESSTKLQAIHASNTYISDLKPLRNCTLIEHLDLSGTRILNLSGLHRCNRVKNLDASRSQLQDITAIKHLRDLQTLDISITPVRDISSLSACQQLNRLHLAQTKVKILSGLSECTSLRYIDLSGTSVTDISSLFELKNLSYVNILKTDIPENQIARLSDNRYITVVSDSFVKIGAYHSGAALTEDVQPSFFS